MVGRPKSFDREQVLAAATDCFWEKGFEGCAVRDLEAATGLGRQSLYNEFGDKRQLYLAVLSYYLDTSQDRTFAPLQGGGSPLARVEALIRATGAYAAADGCKGCLVANAGAEADGGDAQVSALLREGVRRQDDAIVATLREAVSAGELSKDFPFEATARALGAVLQGLVLRGRMGVDPSEIGAAVEGAIRLLRR
ncbi:MAG: TetR/AcrR family transcriptional regulator [Alphaproteobacteria bacterium]|nr:TetR/AcrR family transcriptional regulator [Alphaproteobacteria bacterium]